MPDRRPVWLLANANANARGPGRSSLRAVIGDAARLGAVVRATRSLAELDDAAKDLVRAEARAVIVLGGDGTCMATATAIARAAGDHLPDVAVVPGGTVCTIARNWNPPSFAPRARVAARLVRAVIDGRARRTTRPSLRVDDGDATRIGFIFGAGLVANFFRVYDRAPHPGRVSAAAIAARAVASALVNGPFAARVLAPLPARVTVDGIARDPATWTLIVASAVRDVGLHLVVTPRAGDDPSRVHVVASPLPPRAIAPQVARVVFARPLVGEGNVDALARELTIDANFAYVLDGDSFHAKARVVVTAGPSWGVLSL